MQIDEMKEKHVRGKCLFDIIYQTEGINKLEELKNKTVTLKELASICGNYDAWGLREYREDRYQGHAVFQEIFEKLTGLEYTQSMKYDLYGMMEPNENKFIEKYYTENSSW